MIDNEKLAQVHHRDACLNNHTEADCAAVILAARIINLRHDMRQDEENANRRIAELEAEVREYRSAICFDVTCLNCAKLLDKLASAEAALASAVEKADEYKDRTRKWRDKAETAEAALADLRGTLADQIEAHYEETKTKQLTAVKFLDSYYEGYLDALDRAEQIVRGEGTP